MPTKAERGEKPRWLDDPRNVDRVARTLYVACALLVVIDLFVPKHGLFSIEHIPGFYAFYGFASSVFLVLTAKQLRRILIRPENYYDQ